MATLTVGAGKDFSTIASAIAASADGDVINVDAGTYTNDFSYVNTKVTIQGVGGMVHLVATVAPPNGKAILCTEADITLRNLDFSGVAVADMNGAGIRQEGGNLTVDGCSFRNNQEGILAPGAGNGTGSLTITNSTFSGNGAGDGYSHNIYAGYLASFSITNSLITGAVVGHEIKSRALNSVIENNQIIDGPNGTASYSIDLPNGGNALVSGNTIEKGPNAQNSIVVHFGGEGLPFAGSSLTITGNTLTNDLTSHPTAFLVNQTVTPVTISGNQFDGVALGTVAVGPSNQTGNTENGVALQDLSSTALALGGNATVITDDMAHTMSMSAGSAVQGSGGLLTLTGQGHETIVGGAGGIVYQGSGGGDGITTAAGSVNTINLAGAGSNVISFGRDSIASTTGNDVMQIMGNASISGSTGASSFVLNGNDLLASHGADTISIGSSALATVSGGSFLTITDNGGSIALTRTDGGATHAATVSGGSVIRGWAGAGLNITTAPGVVGAAVNLAGGNNQVYSAGADTIRAGAGNDTVIVSAGAQIYAGSGALSVFGRTESSEATVHGADGVTTTIDGDTGNIDYVGSMGGSTVQANLGQISINGGAGRLTINAPGGRQTINGGSGGIVLNTKAGADLIHTAAGSANVLSFNDSNVVYTAGNDIIRINAGGNSLAVSGVSAITATASGNCYTVSGTAMLTGSGTGTSWVYVGATGNAIIKDSSRLLAAVSSGYLRLNEVGGGENDALAVRGQATVNGVSGAGINVATTANGADMITLSAGKTWVYSAGADTISVGAGTHCVTSTGRATVVAGSGSLNMTSYGTASVHGGSGRAVISNGVNALSFVGGTGNATIYGAVGTMNVTAGSGNITLTGGSGSRSFVAGSGHASVSGGAGPDLFEMGSGQTTATSGWGQETYEFLKGHGGGTDLINNFKIGTDKLAFIGFGAGGAIASQASTPGGLQLKLADGTSVTMSGIAQLTSAMLA